jgi:hypothetical protein
MRTFSDHDYRHTIRRSRPRHFMNTGNKGTSGIQQFAVQRLQSFDFSAAHTVGSKHNFCTPGYAVRPIDAYHALLPEHFHHLRIVNDRTQRNRRRSSCRRVYRPAHAKAKTRVLCNDNFSDRNQLPTFLYFSFANKSKFR